MPNITRAFKGSTFTYASDRKFNGKVIISNKFFENRIGVAYRYTSDNSDYGSKNRSLMARNNNLPHTPTEAPVANDAVFVASRTCNVLLPKLNFESQEIEVTVGVDGLGF